jgi:BirA family transcriptional regulator, biotin operon repressor / biotin---[acetyl-CoA-carboxylase] ligase
MNLDWNQIAEVLGQESLKLRSHVVVDTISSTNDWSAWSCGNDLVPAVCIAEQQTSGRGRNNRKWVSLPGENIYLTLVWPFTIAGDETLNGLSLVVGIAISRVLMSYKINDVKLKWPNDVLVKGEKIAGILIETKINQIAGLRAVIGIGLNYSLSEMSRLEIGRACTDLLSALGDDRLPDRNHLTGEILKELIHTCEAFQQHGFSAFANEWKQYDACCNKEVNVHDASGEWTGWVNGLNHDCGLRVLRDGNECVVYSADVSIRIK